MAKGLRELTGPDVVRIVLRSLFVVSIPPTIGAISISLGLGDRNAGLVLFVAVAAGALPIVFWLGGRCRIALALYIPGITALLLWTALALELRAGNGQ
jgi:hypothetical protein